MRLPRLRRIPTTSVSIGTFGGLNESVVCPDGEFAAVRNMSTRFYPAAGTRPSRGAGYGEEHTGNGLIYVDGIFEVMDTYCTYKGERVPDLVVVDGPKRLVKMGAIILIFPDKKFYNTADGTQGDLGWMYRSDTATDPPKITVSGDEHYTRFTAEYYPESPSSLFAGLYAGDSITIENNFIWEEVTPGSDPDNPGDIEDIEDIEDITGGSGGESEDIGGGSPEEADDVGSQDTSQILDYTTYNGTYIISRMIEDTQYIEWEDIQTGERGYTKVVYTYGFEIPVAFNESAPAQWDPEEFTTSAFYRFEREVPQMDIVFECNNRVWGSHYSNEVGAAVNEIYASKLGNAKNWNVFEGTAMDSYALSIGSGDVWTGGINFNGQPLFMKEDYIYIMYGDRPANFQLVSKYANGALWPKSLVMIGQLLYYAGRDGIYVFDGTTPRKISEKIKKTLTDCVAGEHKGKYYLSCKADNVWTLYCYDPSTGIWMQEDDTEFRAVTKAQGHLYYIDSDYDMHDIASEPDQRDSFDWLLESGDIVEGSLDMKYISKFRFNVWLMQGTFLKVQMKYDDEEWTEAGYINSYENKTYNFPVIPKRCNKYRWRLSGIGHMKLLGIGREIEGGTELNGNT